MPDILIPSCNKGGRDRGVAITPVGAGRPHVDRAAQDRQGCPTPVGIPLQPDRGSLHLRLPDHLRDSSSACRAALDPGPVTVRRRRSGNAGSRKGRAVRDAKPTADAQGRRRPQGGRRPSGQLPAQRARNPFRTCRPCCARKRSRASSISWSIRRQTSRQVGPGLSRALRARGPASRAPRDPRS
jgi:hypothetical protein